MAPRLSKGRPIDKQAKTAYNQIKINQERSDNMSHDKPITGLPYSPAYAANGLLFVSGQIPIDA